MSIRTAATGAALGLALALPAVAQETPAPAVGEGQPPLIAEIKTAQGESRGVATLVGTRSGMTLITLELTGLPAGIFGVHIHQTGECSPPDFESAGGHLAGDKDHGVMAENGPHPGDLPNIHVPENGALTVEYFSAALTPELVGDEDGSAIIVHEHPDDYVGQPTGHAGARLGCGVFAKAS